MKIYILILLVASVYSYVGVQTSPLISVQDTFDCLKGLGYTFANIRAFSLEGGDLDLLTVRQSVIFSNKAGLRTDLFLRTCRGKNPKYQIDAIVLGVPSQYYTRIWIELDQNPNVGCGWPTDYTSNCNYVKDVFAQLKYFNVAGGVYVRPQFYKTIFGEKGCDLSSYPLVYVENDGSPSFDGYKPFGGWSSPWGKMFQRGQSACSININKLYQKQL